MLNSSLWEAAVWFCFWTAQEEGACPGEPCTGRILHRVTGYYLWHWGPECEHQDNSGPAGLCIHRRTSEAGRLAEGRCDPSRHHTLTVIPGYWWPCYPWSLLAGPKSLLPLCLGSIQTCPETLWSQTMWVHLAAAPVNRIPKSFLVPSPGELLHLPPLPSVSHCLPSSQLSHES